MSLTQQLVMLPGILGTGTGVVQVDEVLGSLAAAASVLGVIEQQDLPLGVSAYAFDVAVSSADEAGVDV